MRSVNAEETVSAEMCNLENIQSQGAVEKQATQAG